MEKALLQLKDLEKALKKLKEAIDLPENEINRDATIQRFEFTFELAWKLMQTLSQESSQNVYGPKNAIREAAKLGFIENPEKWFEYLKKRNLASHTYNEEQAKEVYKVTKEFVSDVDLLVQNTKGKI